MPPSNRQAKGFRHRITACSALLFAATLLIGVTPFSAEALLIYESAPNGPLATPFVDPSPYGDPPPGVVVNQSLGVRFYVPTPVTTGSIRGYFAPYETGIASDIIGAIVRLSGPYDFPNSFNLRTSDVLGKADIHISTEAGNYAGDLSVSLTGGWYALVFAAAGSRDQDNALMPRLASDIGDPLYFFGRTTTDGSLMSSMSSGGCSTGREPRGRRSAKKGSAGRSSCESQWWNSGFEYLDGGGAWRCPHVR